MPWRKMLAYITGTVDQELLLRNEYLAAENRILRAKIRGRLVLTDPERTTLARIGKRLGRKALDGLSAIVRPDTILAWHRKLIAKKFDGSAQRKPGRPHIPLHVEQLVVRIAQENRNWGYDRIAGALGNLGHDLCDETVGNILRRHGIAPAPERKQGTTWKEFIESHREVLAATDFFTAEVWTLRGLVTYYVLFFIDIANRKVHVAGMTPHPHQEWMSQIARNVTMEDWGFLRRFRLLIHDRDSKFCARFRAVLRSGGVRSVKLPVRSSNLNPFAERVIGSIRRECTDHIIALGEDHLRRVLRSYVEYYNRSRCHLSLDGNAPEPREVKSGSGPVRAIAHLGGLHHRYTRAA